MRVFPILLTAVLPVAAAAQQGAADAAATITPESFLRGVGIIAHDSLRGRNTPSPGLERTALWLADQLRAAGLRPAGDAGAFIQRYPLRETRLDTAQSGVEVWSGPTWRFGREALLRAGGRTGAGGLSGPTFVISGRPAAGDNLSDPNFQGAVLFLVGDAADDGRLANRLFRNRPAAVVLVRDIDPALRQRAIEEQLEVTLAPAWREGSGRGAVLIEVTPQAASPPFAANGFDLAAAAAAGAPFRVQHLSGLNVTIHIRHETVREIGAPNVVAVLDGSDPLLRAEYVAFSAHMDHVGAAGDPNSGCRGTPLDSICNGADDDASGTIGILEAARAFARMQPRPRRSLLFVWVSGEEKGLWGSNYFSEQPTVPLDRVVANLNADMIGRNWRDSIVVIGQEHSDLGTTLARVNAAHPELGMTPAPDLWPGERFYFRSDHFNFARKGVPILFFFNGTHDDYHRPSDEPARIDGEKASRIVKLIFYLGLEVANADQRPRWDPESYRQIVEGGNRE